MEGIPAEAVTALQSHDRPLQYAETYRTPQLGGEPGHTVLDGNHPAAEVIGRRPQDSVQRLYTYCMSKPISTLITSQRASIEVW